ncbi:hypothetical protein [Rhizobium sp. SSA_523]|uniref:hypothetical protein n=1 Tax=Rhizobium sp. SSA_523 TaxID=2952477 RepID=UPI0020919ADE|nr:hypothetical protein [Rhizobium sp. SSA_523]MCO5730063.1 hypothetical protein [Rhizobium sp. SSA_523]
MVSALLSFVSGLVVSFLKEALADWRRDRDLKKAWATEAALETQRKIQEGADVQHQNDMADRGTAADVAGRLRQRLRPGSLGG